MPTFRLDCPHCRGTNEGIGGGTCPWCNGGIVERTLSEDEIEDALREELDGLVREDAYDALLQAHEDLREAVREWMGATHNDPEHLLAIVRIMKRMATKEEPDRERAEKLQALRELADEVRSLRAWARGRVKFWERQYEANGDAGSNAARHEAINYSKRLDKLPVPVAY